jgi:hypothetical protein
MTGSVEVGRPEVEGAVDDVDVDVNADADADADGDVEGANSGSCRRPAAVEEGHESDHSDADLVSSVPRA